MTQLTCTGAGPSAGGLFVYDTFTDADGVSLDAHTPEVYAVGGWTENAGDWDINSNRARPGAANPNLATIDAGRADCEIETDIVVAVATLNGIVVRYTDTNNYWNIYIDGTNFEIVRIQAGVGVKVATSATGTGAGTHRLWVRLRGATITARLDDAVEIEYNDATFNQTVTRHGLRGRKSGFAQFDYVRISRVTNSVLGG